MSTPGAALLGVILWAIYVIVLEKIRKYKNSK